MRLLFYQLQIVLDNTVVSSPVVESPISQPSQEVPTITLDQLQNPQGQANPVQ